MHERDTEVSGVDGSCCGIQVGHEPDARAVADRVSAFEGIAERRLRVGPAVGTR
jgi:hypothetical protein